MNYLAHLLLSGDQPQHQIGGLLGDFVKGPLKGELPTAVEQGIRLHRSIDVWVDQQPEVLAAQARFEPPFRRYAGIVLDITYDHLLARQWSRHHNTSLEQFASDFYHELQANYQWLPARAQRFADNAPAVGLLESYQHIDAITTALQRISLRLRKPFPLEQAWPILERDLSLLDNEFEAFFPRLSQFASDELQRLQQAPGTP